MYIAIGQHNQCNKLHVIALNSAYAFLWEIAERVK